MSKLFDDSLNAHEPKPEKMEHSTDVMFLAGAIRAAKNSNSKIRQKLMADMRSVLKCSNEELEFLIAANNHNFDKSIYDFPDADRRRYVIENNLLDAAE